MFSFNARLAIFTKTLTLNNLKLAHHHSCYKILGKHHVAGVRQKNLNPYQATSVLGLIMPNNLALDPAVNYRMNSLTTILPYPWKVVA